MNTYHTIKSKTEGLYKEKGSKFLAFAIPVVSPDQIKSELERLKKSYHDARHHCYAWVLGMDNQQVRSNDDGEPSHSAGDPILGQIRSSELTNTLVVVVRYFGGTKLGVGGLIHAYKTAAEDALSQVDKIQIFETSSISMKFSYDLISTVEKLVSDFDIEVADRDFQSECRISGKIKKEYLDKFLSKTADLYAVEFEIE